jgi:hypothetical protein
MVADIQRGKVMVADFDFQWVGFVRTGGRDPQAGGGARAANQPQHLLQTIQRFSCPVQPDGTKQAVFDRIPFRCAGWVMGNRDGQAVLVGPLLQRVLPQSRAIPVAASSVPSISRRGHEGVGGHGPSKLAAGVLMALRRLGRAQQVWERARSDPTAEHFGELAEQYSVEPNVPR